MPGTALGFSQWHRPEDILLSVDSTSLFLPGMWLLVALVYGGVFLLVSTGTAFQLP